VYDLGSYSHVRGYLHTKNLRWSFGAMRGREADNWARQTFLEPPEAMIRRLAYRGFDGLFVDKRGLAPERADGIVEGFRRVLGSTADAASAPIVHEDGQQLFFDLRSYRAWLVSQLGADGYARAAKAEEEQVTVLWLKGFPVVDLKPLRTGLTPRRSSACAVRALSFFPATVFQMANLHPPRHPLHP
jgi:phosphoglycerol transferase